MDDTEYPKRASLEGLVGEIFKLVSRGATPEQWAEWLRVPLEHAAADGNIGLFNALIGAGADGSAGWRGCHDRTLFHAAARGGSAEVVSALVAAGAGPDVNVVSAACRRSALYLATSLGHEDAARRLVMAGADVSFRNPDDGCDALTKATVRGFEELVNNLLISGADPNIHSVYGSPLHAAAQSGFEGIVSTLLTRGADKDALDADGDSPLVRAAQGGHLAIVNRLLAVGADLENRAGEYTPLSEAARCGHIGVLKVILEHGAAVNAAGEDGCTVLHHAAHTAQPGAIDLLIEAGADTERKAVAGWTPLCYAVSRIDASCTRCTAVRALYGHGANARVQDNNGNTLLHLACRSQPVGVDTTVDLLLRCGADETTVNNDGKIPAQMLQSRIKWGRRCSQKELQRAQVLLARAPNDRAWRRRCWLVMLRSRISRARKAVGDEFGVSRHGSNATDGGGESRGSEMPRIEHVEWGESGVVGQASDGCAISFGHENGSLGTAVVAPLIGLGLEGVFRTVLGFL